MIIGLTGQAHSGKDTCADYLVENLLKTGISATKIGLADQLKTICQRLIKVFYGLEIPLDDFYDLQKKEKLHEDCPRFAHQTFKLRTILQMVGTEVFRDCFSEDIWCAFLWSHLPDSRVVIVNDFRQHNEISYFRQPRPFKVNCSIECLCQKLISLFYGLDLPISDFTDPRELEKLHPDYPQFADQVFQLSTILQWVKSNILRDLLSDTTSTHQIDPFYCIRVSRDQRIPLASTNSQHISETQVSQLSVDLEIINNGTLSELYDVLDSHVVSTIKKSLE
jgi:hypothetical protein